MSLDLSSAASRNRTPLRMVAWLAAWLSAALASAAEPGRGPDRGPEAAPPRQATAPTEPGGARRGPPTGLRFSLRGGVVHQLDGSLDEGGRFQVTRTYVRPGVVFFPAPNLTLALSAGWNQDLYEFKGSSGLAGLDPWDKVHSLRAGAFVRWTVEDRWTIFLLPTIRTSFEEGGSAGQGIQGGGFAGFSYRFSDTLEIGPGFGAISQIEDSPSVFPVILVDWRITEDLTLRTGRGLGATQGPGLSLVWAFADGWDLTVGGRYDRLRFRLDDRGVAPGGVGEEAAFPIYAGVSYAFGRRASLSLLGGTSPYGELRLEDADGARITADRHDPTGFVGLLFELSF